MTNDNSRSGSGGCDDGLIKDMSLILGNSVLSLPENSMCGDIEDSVQYLTNQQSDVSSY
jgi:hypothetical protein